MSTDVIKKAFHATEEDFVQLVKRTWLSQPQIASVGSCCLVGAISGDVLYVANLGDSRAVLGRRSLGGKSVVVERLSTDHNVSVEEVRKEVVELHPDDKQIVVHTRGAWRIKGIIQVTNLSPWLLYLIITSKCFSSKYVLAYGGFKMQLAFLSFLPFYTVILIAY